MEDVQRADRASAVLAIVGIVNVPIIHYSVTWWNSLHQAPSVMKLAQPSMPASMPHPSAHDAFRLYALLRFTVLLIRLRGEILNRERSASWIREAVSLMSGLADFFDMGGYAAYVLALIWAHPHRRGVEYRVGQATTR